MSLCGIMGVRQSPLRRRERERIIVYERISHLSNIKTRSLYVCCQLISNDFQYINSGSSKPILVSRQLFIKKFLGCRLFRGFNVKWIGCMLSLSFSLVGLNLVLHGYIGEWIVSIEGAKCRDLDSTCDMNVLANVWLTCNKFEGNKSISVGMESPL